MKRLVGGWLPSLILTLALSGGCLSVETKRSLEERQTQVASLQLRLKAAEAANTPDIPQVRAELQVAEAELTTAKAAAIRERVEQGFEYAEVGAKIISTPVELLFPALGPALTGLVGLLGAARTFFSPKVK